MMCCVVNWMYVTFYWLVLLIFIFFLLVVLEEISCYQFCWESFVLECIPLKLLNFNFKCFFSFVLVKCSNLWSLRTKILRKISSLSMLVFVWAGWGGRAGKKWCIVCLFFVCCVYKQQPHVSNASDSCFAEEGKLCERD